jgi:hypothetical protein
MINSGSCCASDGAAPIRTQATSLLALMGSLRVVFPKPERSNPFRVIDLDQSGQLADRIMRLGMLQVMKLSVGPGLAGRAGPRGLGPLRRFDPPYRRGGADEGPSLIGSARASRRLPVGPGSFPASVPASVCVP